jgi:GT2 family glycosyltransferase
VLFSVVIISFTSEQVIRSCLDSVFAQSYKDTEVILVDNGSSDSTINLVREGWPQAVLVKNKENLGASKARNQGIELSKGSWILGLDCDIILGAGFFSAMLNKINSLPEKVGIIQPKVLMLDGETIYSTGIHRSFLRRFYDIGSGSTDNGSFNQGRYCFGASSAAACYRREALESIKEGRQYFDEDLFYLFEDVDLSWRLKRKGWRILYYPDTACLHKSGASRRKDKFSQYLCFRNRYLLLAKNESRIGFLGLILIFFLYDVWRNLFMLIRSPRYFLKGSSEVISMLPRMFKKRRYG